MEAIKVELQKDLEIEQKEQSNILNKLIQEHTQIKTKIQNWNLKCTEDLSITVEERIEVVKPF